jgi:hypothetical protein
MTEIKEGAGEINIETLNYVFDLIEKHDIRNREDKEITLDLMLPKLDIAEDEVRKGFEERYGIGSSYGLDRHEMLVRIGLDSPEGQKVCQDAINGYEQALKSWNSRTSKNVND